MKLLAFDTSANVMSLAVCRADADADADADAPGLWQLQGEGGAKASASLIGNVLDLLKKADLALTELDAICFGCGPGYFTGLRTACAVAQGLAFGANVPVLPVNSLLALAEEARFSGMGQAARLRVCAMLDARMDEIYLQQFDYAHGQWNWAAAPGARLLRPQDLTLNAAPDAGDAGNTGTHTLRKWPQAMCLRCMPSGWAALPPMCSASTPCRRPRPCCGWPRSCWQQGRRWRQSRRCPCMCATRWHTPAPNAPPTKPRKRKALPHERPLANPGAAE